MRLTPDPNLKTHNNGQILIGGSPTTMLKLSRSGASKVTKWFRGTEVGGSPSESELAERLLATGMAHRTDTDPSLSYAVVIPMRNDPDGLARTLGLLEQDESLEIHVVEDSGPIALGPAGARNLGATRTNADVLVFVDAGVEIEADAVRKLASQFVGATVAIAPRIVTTETPGRIGAYEATHSPLDLGRLPGIVNPGTRISYVPSTVLAVRREGFEAIGGFDPDLRYGEDVDLVWRLSDDGGEVRYVPSITATHPPRGSLTAFAKQRFRYGTAAGPLAARHGNNVAPVALSGWSVATLGLAAAPLPKTLMVWLAGLSVGLSKKMPEPCPLAFAADMTIRGNFAAVEAVAKASTRAWWPVAVVGLASPLRSRILVGWLWSWLKHRTLLGLVDDVAYGSGLWRGTLRAMTARSVLPHFGFGRAQSKRSSS